jgi:hypothetical protein
MTKIAIRSLRAWLLLAMALVWSTVAAQPAAHPPLPYQTGDKSVGVVNCANSLCHGSVQPFKDSNVLQNEYVTWSRVDKHARAYKVLSNEQSARIARNLGIGNAWEAKICVDCHAHNIPKDKRGDRSQPLEQRKPGRAPLERRTHRQHRY